MLLLITPFICQLSFALPQQQKVTGNLDHIVNGEKTQFLFKNTDEDSGQLTIKTHLQQQVFAIQELPYQAFYQIYFDDYNFDGYTDIAVSAPDMGMGVYSIFDIFLYQPISKNYQALDREHFDFSHSQCSIFADIQLVPLKQQMSSSCRGGAKWWTDTYQFKNGQWKLLKSEAGTK